MQLRERISASGARRLRRLNSLIAGGGISLVGDRTTKRHERRAPARSMARNALQLVRQLHRWLSACAYLVAFICSACRRMALRMAAPASGEILCTLGGSLKISFLPLSAL